MKTIYLILLAAIPSITTAQQLRIQGGYLVNTGQLTLQNTNLVNDGTLLCPVITSNLVFDISTSKLVSGSGSSYIYNLTPRTLNAARLIFDQNATVMGNIWMANGNIDLGNATIVLTPAALINNESETHRITSTGTGELMMTLDVNNPSNLNPGGMGILLTSSSNLGSTTFRRGHQVQTIGAAQGVQRYFSIEPANNANLNASIQFNYFDAELNGISENNLALHEKVGAAAWKPLVPATANPAGNSFQRTGLGSLNRYTLFPGAQSALPLNLLAFSATCKPNAVLFQWLTSHEVNTKSFHIERSNDGAIWQDVKTVSAQSAITEASYSVQLDGSNASYYRLRMEDIDGKYTYSPVKKLNCDVRESVVIGPNPTAGLVSISMQLSRNVGVLLQVSDARGAVLQSKKVFAKEGLNLERLDLSSLAAGSYFITLKYDDGSTKTYMVMKN